MYIASTKLSNGLKYHEYKIKNENENVFCSLTVRAGSLCDIVHGTAHFVEHLLLSFVKKYGINYEKEIPVTGKTSFDRTSYYFACNKTKLGEVINFIKIIIEGMYLREEYFETVKNDILNEYEFCNDIIQREQRFLSKVSGTLNSFIPIGTIDSIKSVSFGDIKNYFNKEYRLDNMLMIICGDVENGFIDEQINLPINRIEKVNSQLIMKKQYNSNIKVNNDIEIFFPILYIPFINNGEIYDYLLVLLITHILSDFSSNEMIYVGIKEYTKNIRYVNIKVNREISIYKLLSFLRNRMLGIQKQKIDIEWIKNEIINKLIFQINGPRMLDRIEDFYIYDMNYYDIYDAIQHLHSLCFNDIKIVISNLLKMNPLLLEKNCSQIFVKKLYEWSV